MICWLVFMIFWWLFSCTGHVNVVVSLLACVSQLTCRSVMTAWHAFCILAPLSLLQHPPYTHLVASTLDLHTLPHPSYTHLSHHTIPTPHTLHHHTTPTLHVFRHHTTHLASRNYTLVSTLHTHCLTALHRTPHYTTSHITTHPTTPHHTTTQPATPLTLPRSPAWLP